MYEKILYKNTPARKVNQPLHASLTSIYISEQVSIAIDHEKISLGNQMMLIIIEI